MLEAVADSFAGIGPESFAPNTAVMADSYGKEHRVEIRKGYYRGSKVYRVHAPGYVARRFFDPCKAARYLERLPNFKRWEV